MVRELANDLEITLPLVPGPGRQSRGMLHSRKAAALATNVKGPEGGRAGGAAPFPLSYTAWAQKTPGEAQWAKVDSCKPNISPSSSSCQVRHLH